MSTTVRLRAVAPAASPTALPRRTSLLLCGVVLGTSLLGGCMLRASLRPEKNEERIVLWQGVTLTGVGDAEIELGPRTPVRVTARDGGDCTVTVPGKAEITGKVACARLGLVAKRPTTVHLQPDGLQRLAVNAGVLLAPKERRGDWVRVTGESIENFEGWVRAADVGTTSENAWLAPGLSRFPWACADGTYVFAEPKGAYLTYIPGPWCRVSVLEEKDGWTRIEYLDQRVRVTGWAEADTLAPDREPRFHPGAVSASLSAKALLYAKPGSKESFGVVEAGSRVWASMSAKGRTLVQTQGTPNDIVGWVESSTVQR